MPPEEPADKISLNSCEKELLELERFPDSSACRSVLRSVEVVLKLLPDSVVDELPDKPDWLPVDDPVSIL